MQSLTQRILSTFQLLILWFDQQADAFINSNTLERTLVICQSDRKVNIVPLNPSTTGFFLAIVKQYQTADRRAGRVGDCPFDDHVSARDAFHMSGLSRRLPSILCSMKDHCSRVPMRKCRNYIDAFTWIRIFTFRILFHRPAMNGEQVKDSMFGVFSLTMRTDRLFRQPKYLVDGDSLW